MTLSAGTRIGSFEITGSLGAGGMGEVYRARDTKLGREVALKILPAAFAGDPDRLMRFEREARTLAALNHPHIAQVYGVEEGLDASGTATRALVMELVDGEDLAQRLTRGPIPLDEALPIARQIAEALEAAHEQGIIHRDLKPANIKLRPDGTVKVLDFGLAKAIASSATASGASGPAGASAMLANSPTITSPALTMQGMLLGTAAYMSPEQVKGREADRRSDIWAFGCVLFEMLTARRAFDGDDVSDTLAVVLRGEPKWTALPEGTPPAMALLIRRSLERDPRRRISGTAALRFVLDAPAEMSAQQPDDGARTAAAQQTVDRAIANARSRVVRARIIAAVAIALAVAVAAAVALQTRAPVPHQPLARFVLGLGDNPVASSGRHAVAVSRDGTHIAYVSTGGRLFLRRLADFDAQMLALERATSPVAAGINSPVFAPDGRAIAYYAPADGAIKRVAVSGGAPVKVCSVVAPASMTWDATGILVGQGSKGIVRCAGAGATPEVLAQVGDGEEAFAPQILPNGKALIFTVARSADGSSRWDRAAIVAQPLPSGERTTLIAGGSDGRYLRSGHLVYALAGSLLAVPFDASGVQVTGEPVPVVEGVRRTLAAATGVAQFAISDAGTLVYVPGPVNPSSFELIVATADRNGAIMPLPVPPAPYSHVRASPDGTRVALGTDDGRDANVFIHRLDAKIPLQRLTLVGGNRYPIWSPDGLRVAFQSDRDGDRAIYIQRADGTGVAQRLTRPAAKDEHIPESWSPDGAFLSIGIRQQQGYALALASASDGKVVPFGGVRSLEPIGSTFSPDGRWLAYASSPITGGGATANRGIFVQPFPATGEIVQAPKQALDFHPVWSRDGGELIWIPSAASGQIAVAAVTSRQRIEFGSVTTVPQRVTADRPSSNFRAYDVLPDERFIGLVYATDSATSRVTASDLRVVLNWFQELEQKVPPGR